MSKTPSLREALSAVLPAGLRCRYTYIRTPSRPCDALFSPLPDRAPEKTRMASHFLGVNVILDRKMLDNSPGVESSVLSLGLEVLVYSTRRLTTIFVSKADSTGFESDQGRLPNRRVCTTFLDWLVTSEIAAHAHRKVVVSLFARSQPQYLFPGSSEHPGKHVLDDRGLVKWWAKTLDPLLSQLDPHVDGRKPELKGYLTIPGYSTVDLRSYFPADARLTWRAGDPLRELALARNVSEASPTRCLLPRFPDDPKARFMTDLDEEVGLTDDSSQLSSPSKKRQGNWKSIRSLDRFWEAMEFRQECSSGRLIGFLWVVISPVAAVGMALDETPRVSAGQTTVKRHAPAQSTTLKKRAQRERRKPLTGPIVSRKPRLKGSSLAPGSSPLRSKEDMAPEGGVEVSREGYDAVMQTLLHLDFANWTIAEESSRRWTREAATACGMRGTFSGTSIVGTAVQKTAQHSTDGSTAMPPINDLGGMVRKKRKIADDRTTQDEPAIGERRVGDDSAAASEGVNLLHGSLLRKKPK